MRFLIMLLFILTPVYVFAMSNMSNSISERANTGTVAADFTLPTTAGNNLSLAQARNGKKAVLFFWATWCPHCHEELEKLRQIIDTIKEKNIQVLLVDIGESKEEAKAYLKHQNILLDSFVDEENTVAELYGVTGVPTLFFIDEQGIIRDVDHGLPADYEDRFNSR